jgi:glycosyltransferase involved in cell wall biosynthesis
VIVDPGNRGAIDVAVIVCTHNRASTLRQVLEHLRRQQGMADDVWEVIVVDNGSSDDTREIVDAAGATEGPPVRYVFESRRGKSSALNTGIAISSAPILVFTDDDVEIPDGWLAAMVHPFRETRCLGVAGPVIARWVSQRPSWVSDAEPRRMMAAIVQYSQGDRPGPTQVPPVGANCAFRREAFERFGTYLVDLGHTGGVPIPGEDTEFGRRLLEGGAMIWYAPDAYLYHPVSPERLTKRYFLDWYLRSGRADAYMPDIPAGTVRWFGIPRYLYGQGGAELLRWWLSWGARRFYHKLLFYRTWGSMGEFHRLGPGSRK